MTGQEWLVARRPQFFKDLWREYSGRKTAEEKCVYEDIVRTEWSLEFETLMRNRLIMGAMRYGLLGSPDKPKWDRMARAEAELELFRKDRDKERLVDIANMMLLEFVEGEGTLVAKDGGGIYALDKV